jgi:predicted amidohydrolase YtcJ
MNKRQSLDLVIRNAELAAGPGDVVGATVYDIGIRDRMIVSLTPAGTGAAAEHTYDAGGGAVIPGLHDHHIHLLACAAAEESIEFSADLADTVRSIRAADPGLAWLRVVGYHETVHGPVDRAWLDAVVSDRPIRVQHRSGALWVLNTAALDAVGIDSADGRLYDCDDLLRRRVPPVRLDVAAIGRRLAGYGVTGVTDLTPTTDAADWELLADAVLTDGFPVEVMVTGGPELGVDVVPRLNRGPVKIVVGDHRLPSFDALTAAYRAARAQRRAVAVHCVTRVGLMLALAVWNDVGSMPGDRIEHGAVIPLEVLPAIVDLGLTVVTQPSFVTGRGDQYLADVDTDDIDGLWRCGSLLSAGIPVGGSTDAPFGDADPWRAIAAATQRLTRSGMAIGAGERIDARRALQTFLTEPDMPGGRARSVAVGQRADLCILRTPLASALLQPSSAQVAASIGRSGLTIAV